MLVVILFLLVVWVGSRYSVPACLQPQVFRLLYLHWTATLSSPSLFLTTSLKGKRRDGKGGEGNREEEGPEILIFIVLEARKSKINYMPF